jgi:competence protein ComEA
MAKHRWPTTSPEGPAYPARLQRLLDAGRAPLEEAGEEPEQPTDVVCEDHGSPGSTEDGARRPGRRWVPGRGAAAMVLGFCLVAGGGLFLVRDWTPPAALSVEFDAERSADSSGVAAEGAGADDASGASSSGTDQPIAGGTVTEPQAPGLPGAGDPAKAPAVIVHVAGAVRKPGIVRVAAGARVFEALKKAGGALPRAELAGVNLAAPVQDGSQIWVPAEGEAGAPGMGGPAGSASHGELSQAPVNLNTADAAELETLPRVGPVLAARIIEWRTAHGKFSRPEDIDAVSGIGPAMLESLLPLVTV